MTPTDYSLFNSCWVSASSWMIPKTNEISLSRIHQEKSDFSIWNWDWQKSDHVNALEMIKTPSDLIYKNHIIIIIIF